MTGVVDRRNEVAINGEVEEAEVQEKKVSEVVLISLFYTLAVGHCLEHSRSKRLNHASVVE